MTSNTSVVSLAEKFQLFSDYWHPRVVAELNENYVKVVKLHGQFDWHSHPEEDELFWVVKGQLTILLRDKTVVLTEGELCVVPKGVEHCPIAKEEVWVVLIEPKTVLNTGDQETDKTVDQLEFI